jgi:hypothetical protein
MPLADPEQLRHPTQLNRSSSPGLEYPQRPDRSSATKSGHLICCGPSGLPIVDTRVSLKLRFAIWKPEAEMRAGTGAKGMAKVEEVVTVALTDEQRSSIEKATGVSLREISVLKYSGEGARELNSALLQAFSVVACW